jgi:DNA-binding response OmpR family regulator
MQQKKSRRVLTVGGPLPLQKVYAFVLFRIGDIEHVEARTSLDARVLLSDLDIDLAIVDVQIDESYALIEDLRVREIPILASTESTEQAQRARAAGATRCFSIPFQAAELAALVNELLRR